MNEQGELLILGFYLFITYDLLVPINTDLLLKRACSARSSFHSIIPATRTRDICLLWKCLLPPSLHVTIKEKEGCCARARSVTKSYYYESCSKPLTSFYLSLCSVQSYSSTGKPMKLFLPGRGVACMLRLIMF